MTRKSGKGEMETPTIINNEGSWLQHKVFLGHRPWGICPVLCPYSSSAPIHFLQVGVLQRSTFAWCPSLSANQVVVSEYGRAKVRGLKLLNNYQKVAQSLQIGVLDAKVCSRKHRHLCLHLLNANSALQGTKLLVRWWIGDSMMEIVQLTLNYISRTPTAHNSTT